MRLLHATAVLVATAQSPSPLDSFLPPTQGVFAADADLIPAQPVSSPLDCATVCLNDARCVSFNYCAPACGISGWNVSYSPATSSACAWYRRILPRNDAPVRQAVPWVLDVPTSGVALTAGPISDAFYGNVDTYLKVRDPLDMLLFFAKRAGVANPPGVCFGWDAWIKGSAAGNYLMGAGGALRWIDDLELRTNVQTVVNGIRAYAEPDGWLWAFNETNIGYDNLPDYCASWVTRGLLDAAGAGVEGALDLARQSVSTFNNHSSLPFFLPPNGGPHPVQPYPAGFNNVTSGGYGQPSGHMIYIQYQGMIKHTLMALSSAGTQADVDIIQEHYQEDWWLQALLANDTFHGVWHRQFFSHNYAVTAYEAFLDMYVLTGNSTYLQAMQNAWGMLKAQWILNGKLYINEGSYYPPGSYYIGFTGVNVASAHGHGHAHTEDEGEGEGAADPYYHAPCMPQPLEDEAYVTPLVRLKQDAMEPSPPTGGPNGSDPPTGELCGSVFWTKFNQRFHRLFPDQEAYVGEMEASILNVGLAALGRAGSNGQGPNGTGIRYFANEHKQKQNPSMHASCCEGQGTRLFGSLPEYLYTTLPPITPGGGVRALYVDLYTASNISFDIGGGATGVLVTDTAWPYAPNVTLTLTLPAPWVGGDVALRIPAWVAATAVSVNLNGAAWPTHGTPGSYLHVAASWVVGQPNVLTLSLPMAFTASKYVGHTQLPPYSRWGYTYGPVLLAGSGPWNSTADALVMPAGVDPSCPSCWMTPAGDGNALHFTVAGAPGFSFKPYWEVQDAGETFSTYPCFA